jgi:hypothetical protein
MIRHQKKKLQVPSTCGVISPRGLENAALYLTMAKLICMPGFTANGDEISRAESAVKMNPMVELFSNRPS